MLFSDFASKSMVFTKYQIRKVKNPKNHENLEHGDFYHPKTPSKYVIKTGSDLKTTFRNPFIMNMVSSAFEI